MPSYQALLYRWAKTIHIYFPVLNYWQVMNLALFSLGVVMSRSCQVKVVSEELGFAGKASTIEKRLKRFLSHDQFDMQLVLPCWIGWVLASYGGNELDFLVDETKLGQRIGVMMVSLAYRGRAIPIVWRCYREGKAEAYPPEGQVDLIVEMLEQIRPHIPAGCRFRVQADQGIGNSSALMRKLNQRGWYYLFRVKETSMFTTRNGFRFQLREMALEGRAGSTRGILYTRSYRIVPGTLHVIWDEAYDIPWFLFTNDPLLNGKVYARRFWQEEGFRDLKRGGWHWDASFIRDPEHMQPLILVLALAYAWMTALGTLASTLPEALRLQMDSADEAQFSVFRRGLRLFKRLIFLAQDYIYTHFLFIPKDTSHHLLC